MENWLLLAVGIVFLVCMIAGFVISQNWFIPSVNNIDTGTGVIPFPIRVGCADEAYTGAGRTGEEDSGSIYARAFSR